MWLASLTDLDPGFKQTAETEVSWSVRVLYISLAFYISVAFPQPQWCVQACAGGNLHHSVAGGHRVTCAGGCVDVHKWKQVEAWSHAHSR